MSIPPEIIQVKRLVKKRKAADDDDEGIVDYLPEDPSFRRNESTAGRKPPSNPLPVIHASKPGDEKRNAEKINHSQEAKPDISAQGRPKAQDQAPAAPTAPATVLSVSKSQPAPEPRRFHMSRQSLVPSPLFSPGVTTGKRSRYKTPTTVFVERGHKRTRTEDVQMTDVDSSPTAKSSVIDGFAEDSTHARKQKLPGSDRKRAEGRHTQAVRREVPESFQKEQDADMDEITRSMNEFVMQQIGENLARIEERDRKEAAATARRAPTTTSPQPSKFKPRAPVKRYAERHPEISVAQTDTAPSIPTAEGYESLSDDEYIIETYVRVAAGSLDKNLAPEKVGLLVFDNEPDVDLFFGEEGDSDDEWPEDDEDENAEDYYAADYPDEEVDSEDEYNRAAYQYRTGNASDLEEYDEREGEIALDHDGENDGEPDPFRARFGTRPSAAFGRP
ncbi:hypothetical protein INS49_006771 [Diaporthe citri]|uniref:uncharacterized protein n=1 Tax=Diaporthe citri TaxID=83186 RepID=UPI001C7E7070|nr:uncharacterized protein INS49_006771 [Diaporthe citri]KAG6365164.1 hypothetical protein INS49_006771 [Diaporthe citri]